MMLKIALMCLAPHMASADEKLVRLHVPQALVDSGLLKHIVPRFSLKTGVRLEQVSDPAQADLVMGDTGRAIFAGLGQTWHMDIRSADHAGTLRFADWLTSKVGRSTVFGFAPDGTALFAAPQAKAAVVAEVSFDGDAQLGHDVSRSKCTRCHAVDEETRGAGIGSTPSFAVLKSLADWEDRFTAFYALKPHPAFTQITDVTEPFPLDRPSPIAPIEMTLDEVEAVLAYVAAMQAADLGAPLQHQ